MEMRKIKSFDEFVFEGIKTMSLQELIRLLGNKKIDAKSLGVFLYENWIRITGETMWSMNFSSSEDKLISDLVKHFHLDRHEVLKSIHDYGTACNEDFASVGTAPEGNVTGMGAVTPPSANSVGSGDTWTVPNKPATQVSVKLCPDCKKKECICENKQ